MWVPGARIPSRLTLSAFTRAGRFCVLNSIAARWKAVPAENCRGLYDFHPQLESDVGLVKSSSRLYKSRSETKRYVTSPRLAETMVRMLRGKRKAGQLILECNPGESSRTSFSRLRAVRSMTSSFKELLWPVLILTSHISVSVCTLQNTLIKHALRFHYLPKRTFHLTL